MWNPFKRKYLLSDEDYAFQLEAYEWLLKYFGGDAFYKRTELVLPTEAFFPEKINSPTEAAEKTFKYVKQHACMENWPCKLVAQRPDPKRRLTPTVYIQGGDDSPLGTFSNEKQTIEITYNPDLTDEPTQLVATLAHELAHYRTAKCPEPPPGGWDNWEFATDIAAVFMGFGIFMANSAFSFSQYSDDESDGWSSSQSGYLMEAECAFSLAIFLKLKNIDPSEAYPHLDTNIKSYLKTSLKELDESQAHLELHKVKFKPANT